MSLKIKELPEAERPYEKLELYGEKSLSNAELLAIIIKSGTREETSIQIAQRILNLNYDPQMGELNFLKDIDLEELKAIKGIGRVKAIQLKAICELSIRMSKPSNYKKVMIKSTEDVAKLVLEEFRFKKDEYVKLLLLNNRNEIIRNINVAKGGANFANFDIKQVIAEAVKIKAPKMILVHNHPSGDPTPSRRDIEITDKIFNAANMLNIILLDHIVIGNNSYRSILVEIKKQIDKIRREHK